MTLYFDSCQIYFGKFLDLDIFTSFCDLLIFAIMIRTDKAATMMEYAVLNLQKCVIIQNSNN